MATEWCVRAREGRGGVRVCAAAARAAVLLHQALVNGGNYEARQQAAAARQRLKWQRHCAKKLVRVADSLARMPPVVHQLLGGSSIFRRQKGLNCRNYYSVCGLTTSVIIATI
jgi:hypothetical protein